MSLYLTYEQHPHLARMNCSFQPSTIITVVYIKTKSNTGPLLIKRRLAAFSSSQTAALVE